MMLSAVPEGGEMVVSPMALRREEMGASAVPTHASTTLERWHASTTL